MNLHWASFEGFEGCLASATHSAAVLGGTTEALRPGSGPSGAWRSAGAVVLSSWHSSYEPLLDSGVRTVARWHSPLLQTELSEEGWKLARQLELLDAGRVAAVAVDDPALAAVLDRDGVVALPNVLDPSAVGEPRSAAVEGVAVSLFGEPRARKNLLAQSAAFALAAREASGSWTLHLAGQTRRRAGYGRWLDLLGVKWTDHGFLPRPDYLALVAAMDACMTATLSESYGYVPAEHVLLGVPVVSGPAVACLPPGELTVADPGDATALAAALALAVGQGARAASTQRAALLARAADNEEAARAGLAEIERLVAAG